MYRVIMIGCWFAFAHYIQQLDISRLVVQKDMIKKSQQQLDQYFQNQKDGIVIYQTEDKSEAQGEDSKN